MNITTLLRGLRALVGRMTRRLKRRVPKMIYQGTSKYLPQYLFPRLRTGSRSPLFVGHTRFSVHQYGSVYFNATREGEKGVGFSEKEYTRWLYSDQRMAARTEIFTQLSLPQLAQAARKYRVVHYVSFSPSLPDKHKRELLTAARDYDFLELYETTETVGTIPAKHLIRAAAQKHGLRKGPIGVYRLDDDDILSVRYFRRMAPYVTKRHIGWWVSQALGFAAIRMEGRFIYARQYHYPKSAFGPMGIVGFDNGELSHTRAPKHTVVDKTHRTIIDTREPAYFHIRHRGQDSTLGGEAAPFYPVAYPRIRSEGPAHLKQLEKLFPVVAGQAETSPGPASEEVVHTSQPLQITKEPRYFDIGHAGAFAIQAQVPGKERITKKQIRVHLKVQREASYRPTHQTPLWRQWARSMAVLFKLRPARDTPDPARSFFSASGVRYSSKMGEYHTFLPPEQTGVGLVLTVEPPAGHHIVALGFSSEGAAVPLDKLSTYPLRD